MGHDFRASSLSSYRQKGYHVFSVERGKIKRRHDYDEAHTRQPTIPSDEILRIARFYHDKLGVEVELEGAYNNGQLHIWQITESPLPKDVLTKLSDIPQERIIFSTALGRGSINYSGLVVLKEDDNFHNLKAKLDREGATYLVISGDGEVISEEIFCIFATLGSFRKDVEEFTGGNKSHFGRLPQHMEGIACQTTFRAAQQGRQGEFIILPKAKETA